MINNTANAADVDLATLAADLAAASQTGMQVAAERIIKGAAESVQQEAQSLAPLKTGALRDSITIRYVSALKAVVGPSVEYGVYQEFGTGKRGEFPGHMYTIKPKTKKILSFTVGGKRVFAKVVNHPGIKPHPFMRPALTRSLGKELAASLADAGLLQITRGAVQK